MGHLLENLRNRYRRLAISTVQVAFALSILLHLILLAARLPKLDLKPFEELVPPGQNSLAVRLAPPPSPPPSPAVPPQPPAAVRTPPPAPAHRSPPPKPAAPAEKVLTVEQPSASTALPRPAETPRPQAKDDLAAFIEARRRAREPAPAAQPSPPPQPSQPNPTQETEQQRINRLAAENLGLNVTPTFGADKNQGGGIFQIQRIGYESAEFVFFGWNKFISRNTQQMVEVRKGDNPNIQIAVVRKMISIIREHERGDFVWQSRRLGREVNLSARMSDNAGLEDFMMREFYFDNQMRK